MEMGAESSQLHSFLKFFQLLKEKQQQKKNVYDQRRSLVRLCKQTYVGQTISETEEKTLCVALNMQLFSERGIS